MLIDVYIIEYTLTTTQVAQNLCSKPALNRLRTCRTRSIQLELNRRNSFSA
jgi:hypothetical protein